MDSRTQRNESRRRELAEAVGDFLLSEGLGNATLKRMAEAAQTSDRMLVHYFEDKNQLVGAALSIVSERLLELLTSAVKQPMPFSALVETLGPVLRSDAVRPYLRIWLELGTQALAGTNTFAVQTNAIAATMEHWLIQSFQPLPSLPAKELAALALTLIDGCIALDALGLQATSDAALQGLLRLAIHWEAP